MTFQQTYSEAYQSQLTLWLSFGYPPDTAERFAKWHVDRHFGLSISRQAEAQRDHDEDREGDYR